MHDIYGDELFTRQHRDDLLHEAEEERQVAHVNARITDYPVLPIIYYEKPEYINMKIIIDATENHRRVIVEVR